MRIAIFGAGAVGGHFAVRLARAGHDVSVVVRGETLDAIRARGLTLIVGNDYLHADVNASDDPAELGPQELVISTLKSNALGALALGIQPLLARETPVIFAQNGVPWWYNHGLRRSPAQPDLRWLDPFGALEQNVGAARTIGGVIFSSNEVVEPGVVRNDSPDYNALFIGEPNKTSSGRVSSLRSAFIQAGLDSPAEDDLRAVLWRKLAANATVSVLCMITGQTARAAVEDVLLSDLVRQLLDELKLIAKLQGYDLPPPPARVQGARS